MGHDHDRRLPEVPGGRPSRFPDYPANESQDAAQAATARRLEREEAFARSGQVAGHDFVREARERER